MNHSLVIACAKEICASNQSVIILHGTGSFGKPPALKYGYLDGHLSHERRDVVAEVSSNLAHLEASMVACLFKGGLRPFRVPLISLARCCEGNIKLTGDLVTEVLARGMTPVIGGNFAFDDDGFVVYSSDCIAVDLAIAMNAESLIFATRAHGVYRNFGQSEEIFERLHPGDETSINAIDSAAHDVSGGMREKIVNGFRAAQKDIPTFVVDGRIPGNLFHSLSGAPLSGTQLRQDVVAVSG